ncbi:MAG: diacylglycerol kinase [Hyphomicrobiales bacterium]|nr:diacylglycerol kinase [Hyphomicrobiales bacterium]
MTTITKSQIPVVIVAAVARNGVIGGGNRLLWRLSSDLKHFKAITLGKPLVMGRKTFESIGKPLPGRETVVITRDPDFHVQGVHVASDIDSGFARASELAASMNTDEIICAGGGDIYAQTLPFAARLEITEVNLTPDGDTYFPALDPQSWREINRENHEPGPGDEAAFSWVTLTRA